ncbi:putative rRNA-processing protein efg-1 [Rosellinia necatrix]|uniref:rRNA-processing protein EFG1 n=1 Tax=Rosellinia necatrix TaxID=77044 RepID=A0A1W2TJT9_ROSNE|nr:putative rRNA-processing protein efg-1 [Rosellinia necatrix]
MSSKRKFSEVSAEPSRAGMPHKRKHTSNHQGPNYKKRKLPGADGYTSISWVKKRARTIHRSLDGKDTLPANVRHELEKELDHLRQKLEDHADITLRKNMITKYHMLRFFEYRAANPLQGSRDVVFTDSAIDPTGRGPLRWRCEVTVGEAPGVAFPGPGAGQQQQQQPPTFGKKKDAKRYAAKCAVQWLREQGFMPSTGGAKFPRGTVSVAQQKFMQEQQQQLQQQRRDLFQGARSPFASPGQQQQPQPQPQQQHQQQQKQPPNPFDPTRPSARTEVAELCQALGIPAPAYRTEGVGDGFYRGWADFGDHTPLLPFGADDAAARVEDVLSDRAAREMVAERLLEVLRAERRRREDADRAFLARQQQRATTATATTTTTTAAAAAAAAAVTTAVTATEMVTTGAPGCG